MNSSKRLLLVGSATDNNAGNVSRANLDELRDLGSFFVSQGWEVEMLLSTARSQEDLLERRKLKEKLQWLENGKRRGLVLAGTFDGTGLRTHGPVDDQNGSQSYFADWGEIQSAVGRDGWMLIDAKAAFPTTLKVGFVLARGRSDEYSEHSFLSHSVEQFLRMGSKVLAGELVRRLAEALGSPKMLYSAGPDDFVLVQQELTSKGTLNCPGCGIILEDLSSQFCGSCGQDLSILQGLENGRYQLIESLGAGGMGTVYLAEDNRLKVKRAIKILSLPKGLDDKTSTILKARMIQEARAAQLLCSRTHHVVQVYDVGISPERDEPYLVMELLEGELLTERLRQNKMTVADTLSIGIQIAEALDLAHRQNIVHRDLKPDNIMLIKRDGQQDFVKLLDFGLVKMEQADVQTQSGLAMGTLQYMPPEQLRGREVGAHSDIFSLGAILFECLSGQRANPGSSQKELFSTLLDKGIRQLNSVVSGLPSELCTIVDACLAYAPADRISSAGALANALKGIEVGGTKVPQARIQPRSTEPLTTYPGSQQTPSLATGELNIERLESSPARPKLFIGIGLIAAAIVAFMLNEPGNQTKNSSLEKPTNVAVIKPAVKAVPDPPAPPLPTINDAQVAESPPENKVFELPAELPAKPDTNCISEGSNWLYSGKTRADVISAAVRDISMSATAPDQPDAGARKRWARLRSDVRMALAKRIPTDLINPKSDKLSIPMGVFSTWQEGRPRSVNLRKMGRIFSIATEKPLFERVDCGKARAGDRLVTARWELRGYSKGRCEGASCPNKMARIVRQAQDVGERLKVKLTLTRSARETDEALEIHTRCELMP